MTLEEILTQVRLVKFETVLALTGENSYHNTRQGTLPDGTLITWITDRQGNTVESYLLLADEPTEYRTLAALVQRLYARQQEKTL